MFRLIFVVFHGESRVDSEVESHLHESPPVMWVPLVLLAIPSLIIGAIVGWGGEHSAMHHFLESVKGFKHHGISDHSNPIPFMIIHPSLALQAF